MASIAATEDEEPESDARLVAPWGYIRRPRAMAAATRGLTRSSTGAPRTTAAAPGTGDNAGLCFGCPRRPNDVMRLTAFITGLFCMASNISVRNVRRWRHVRFVSIASIQQNMPTLPTTIEPTNTDIKVYHTLPGGSSADWNTIPPSKTPVLEHSSTVSSVLKSAKQRRSHRAAPCPRHTPGAPRSSCTACTAVTVAVVTATVAATVAAWTLDLRRGVGGFVPPSRTFVEDVVRPTRAITAVRSPRLGRLQTRDSNCRSKAVVNFSLRNPPW